jgi:adenylate kinase
MQVVFLGPPGAGKGTQAKLLADRAAVPHIATGDIFRAAVRQGTPLGKQAKEYMDRGALVPDEVTIGIVRERLTAPDCAGGFVLDGFPRTAPQAQSLDSILEGMGRPLQWAVYLVVPERVLLSRSVWRRICPSCGAVYHLQSSPPRRPGVCDACGSALVQRDDDVEATVRERLAVYRSQTEPLVGYYADSGRLREVDGTRSIEFVAASVWEAVAADR